MRAWVLGDDIDTDVIVPGRYMKLPIEELARHCLEPVLPSFAKEVRKGDVIVAGRNFGAGSSRELAPAAKLSFDPIPPHLMEMVRDGGLLAHLEKRLKCRTTS